MLNFSVGPVMMEDEILKIGSEQIPYFRTYEFSSLMKKNELLLKDCINAPDDARVTFLTGSGTAAMEASILNLFSKNDKVLVVNGGSFGERFKQICDIHNIKADEIKLNYFEELKQEHLEPFNNKGYTGFLINVHETSTGVLYDMSIVSEFCRMNNLLLVVDAISSFLADPFDMKKIGANAVILSSQKALALPPGMSFILLDSKSQDIISKNKIPSLYFNLFDYLKNGERGQTPFTPAVSILIQLNRKLNLITQQGLDNVISNVAILAKDFRHRVKDLNFPFEIPSRSLSNALTPIRVKGKMNAKQIFSYLKDNYRIFIVPNGGELSETVFRVGHIGALNIDSNKKLIQILTDLNKIGNL